MRYRSDIDGLRAIAVLFVLIFHAGLTLFPSGFIGVDIFFVISGFLITSIITTALNNNKLSVTDFYVRRLWRLQPALIATILFSLIIATIFYLPEDFTHFLREAKYTTLFTSNQYFSRATTAYAAPDTAFLLLLHTWSLSIEWQWYLVLPAALLLLHKYLPSRWLSPVVISTTLAMVALSLYLSQAFPDKSYYFLSSRIFEFLFGSCLIMLKSENLKPNNFMATCIGLAALSALFYCATRTNIVLGYPDYHAVIVAAASAALLYVGSVSGGIVTRALSIPPLVFIGTISYSLYLWHWPIFAAGRYLGFEENGIFTTICLALTFSLAWLSYLFIEKPFRKKRIPLLKSFIYLALLPALLFVVLSAISEKQDGLSWRFGSQFQQVALTLKQNESRDRKYCIDGSSELEHKNCTIGDVNAAKKALLIGDSHSNHFWSFFDVLGKNAHMSVLAQATSSCLTLPGVYLFDWWYFKDTVYQKCHDDSDKFYENIRQGHFDYVIIGEVWSNYAGDNIVNHPQDPRSLELSHQRIETAMKQALDIIIQSGARPVIIKQIYTMPDNFMHCFYDSVKFRKKYVSNSCNTNTWTDDSSEWFPQLFNRLEKTYPTLIIIDPKDAQCSGNVCKTDINGVPVYRDVGHINDFASHEFGVEYLRQHKNPFNE